MEWKKSSAEMVEAFESLVPEAPVVERRKMFGYPCTFVGGNMFMGLHGNDLFLRLSENDRSVFLELDGARSLEPMPGRPMTEYVVVPPWLLEKREELAAWIDKSLAYVTSLPPKVKKKR